jgi:precorrin-6B methylase 2
MTSIAVERIQELARAARMLALIGASLKQRATAGGDPAIRAEIDRGASLALGEASAGWEDADPAELLRTIEMALVESGSLFRNATDPGGWRVTDPGQLEAQGRASTGAFDRIVALSRTRPALAATLTGRFLDIGTGVAAIALRAAEVCPALEIEAIDIWPPALRLAEQRVAASPYAGRIEIRHLDVIQLEPTPRFTLAWLPSMFLPGATVQKAVERIVAASQPGAWLIMSLYTVPVDPFAASVSRLRTLRSGGEITDSLDLAELLRAHGYIDVQVDAGPVATFVFGRLP